MIGNTFSHKTTSSTNNALPEDYVRVLFITGQSNAQGRANSSIASAAEKEAHQNALIWSKANGQFEPLKISSYSNNQSLPSLHGVELPIAMKFKEKFPNEVVYIVKYALGGSNIDDNYINGGVYNEFKDNFFQPAINEILNSGKIPYIHFYYSQGEAEATASRSIDFNFKLNLLIANYKKVLDSKVHFIFPEIITSGILTNDEDINDVFKDFSVTKDNVSVIHSAEYSTDDNLHWNYDGVNQLGEDIFKIMLSTEGGTINTPLPYDFVENNIVFEENVAFTGGADFNNCDDLKLPNQLYNVMFIDLTLANSDNSVINNKTRPFSNLSSAISALPPDNGVKSILWFINGGNAIGCELPGRSLDFYSDKNLTIDFTTINQGGVITLSGGSIESPVEHNFIGTNITIKSDYTGTQKFSTPSIYYRISGNVAFNWKATGGTTSSDYIIQSRLKTNLTIREWYAYATHGSYILGFKDGSTIKVEKLINVDLSTKYTFRETVFNTLHNADITIDEVNMQSGEFRSLIPIKIKKITGTGNINSKKTQFINCVADAGITFNTISATELSGKLTSTNAWTSSTVSALLLINDFYGKINNVLLTGTGEINLKGNNEILVASNFLANSGSNAEALKIINGLTVLNQTNSADVLLTGTSFTVIAKGIIKSNATNLGQTISNVNTVL